MSLFHLYLGKIFQQLNLKYICRNCLLGHRKKIAKFLMRTFTCRSTFLYGAGHTTVCIYNIYNYKESYRTYQS